MAKSTSNGAFGYLISGFVMKNYLKLENRSVGTGIYERLLIDGWCYTENESIIIKFFDHVLKKHKDLFNAYTFLKKRVEK